MKLSEKIIRLRKGRGLSQEELAERLGGSRQVWSTDRSTWQYWWNSNVTGHSWKYFVQKYDLEWLVAALTVLLIVGVVLLVRERKKKLR